MDLIQSKLLSELSKILYNFLPGSGAIYTFGNAAQEIGEADYWIGGSKLPAIQYLLEMIFTNVREKFPDLIVRIVEGGIKYRDKKGSPLTRQEIKQVNKILDKLGFNIKELKDEDFLSTLDDSQVQEEKTDLKHKNMFDNLKLHPLVVEASRSLFIDGHYAQATFEAFKTLNIFVKKKSGRKDLDGQTLMSTVFNEQNPILKINNFANQSDIDEQAGFKFLYMGAMRGIRNPKAHERIRQTDPFRTLKYLAFVSLLIERVEESKKKMYESK